ncbi:MAG: hypothetical protein L3J39_08905 [Verrucomicrobiales bacterium]|nr:hypothetical protein [Verrucomicrobiales bacterium]
MLVSACFIAEEQELASRAVAPARAVQLVISIFFRFIGFCYFVITRKFLCSLYTQTFLQLEVKNISVKLSSNPANARSKAGLEGHESCPSEVGFSPSEAHVIMLESYHNFYIVTIKVIIYTHEKTVTPVSAIDLSS